MNEDLDYNFNEGSSVLGDSSGKGDPDVSNQPVLKQILLELQQMKSKYHTIDRLSLDDKHFTVEQQLELNKRYVTLLSTIELLISEKVKELSNG